MPTLKSIEASGDFKVADMSLADFGRKELDLAEHEMPGLMSSRTEFGPAQPLAGQSTTSDAFAFILTRCVLWWRLRCGLSARLPLATASGLPPL